MKKISKSIRDILPTVSPDLIYEVILTTKSRDGEINAAPMGIKFLDNLSSFLLSVYKDTKTHSNLIESGRGVVNVTRNPILFIKYLAKDKERYLHEEIEDAEIVDVPRLKNMEAYIEFNVEEVIDKISRRDFICKVVVVYEGVGIIEPYSRAVYALVECAVNMSRIEPYLDQGISIERLLKSISYSIDIVKKTASGKIFEEYLKTLLSSLPERSSSLLKEYLSL
ncbi:MAG: DUF447 family protein [Aigarchaeota archaeon]|nr:DUF447 family protein [Aigarchaeota archaeon]MDW7986054.1 DUF447 family protein [Nitrososphaerota archaeon]